MEEGSPSVGEMSYDVPDSKYEGWLRLNHG